MEDIGARVVSSPRGHHLSLDPLDGPGSNAEQAGGFQNTGSLCQLSLHPLLDFRGDLGAAKLNVVRFSPLQAGHYTLPYHRPFKLGEHAHHLKESSSCRRRSINGLLMEIQTDPERMDLGEETKQVL